VGALALLREALEAALRWTRQHRRGAAALGTLAALNVAYAAYRAARSRSDLVNGYLVPARGILFGGKDPYVDYVNISFTPFFYAVVAPLAPLPDALASLVWSVLQLFFLFGALALARGLVPRPARSPLWALALGAPLAVDNLNLGQSNLLALFFVCAAMYSLSVGRHLKAGLLLSVAIAWKLTPAILVGLLLLKGRFRALAGVAAGLLCCLLIVPALVLGPTRTLTLTREWSALVLEPFAKGQKGRTANVDWYHTNQSMEAALQRALTPYGHSRYGGAHRLTDPGRLDEAQAHGVAWALRAVLLALLGWLAWRARGQARLLPLEVALFLLGALFISPASWFSHYVAALVAYAVALEARDERLTRALGVAVALTWVSVGPYLQSHSLVFLGHVALFAALWLHARAMAMRWNAVD